MLEALRFIVLLIATVASFDGSVGMEQHMTLEGKVRDLQESLMKSPAMSMNLDRWKTYVQSAPRNYSMIVIFTSRTVTCHMCKLMYEEFIILAKSYRYVNLHSKALYFAVVNYEDAPLIFQQLGLDTVPAIYHFPAKSSRRSDDNMVFQNLGIDAEAIAKFVNSRTGISIQVLRHSIYAAPVVVLLLIMLVFGFLYIFRNNLDFLWSRTFWGFICLAFVFAFMSGQMWNHIHDPPFIITHPNTHQMSFIHTSMQYQFIVETYIVMVLYACVTAGFVVLNEAVTTNIEPNKKRLVACVGLGLVVIFFSLLLFVFRSKFRSYPYYLLFS